MSKASRVTKVPISQVGASQIKSRQRVAEHGEVFTPDWMVQSMLDLVKSESERIDSRFLEPACGSGNFLVPVLHRKLASVHIKHGKSDFERRHYALLALMCVYGIELLEDNVHECRERLFETFINYLQVDSDDTFAVAATSILQANIVQGDALAMQTTGGEAITFPEWGYLGKGKYQRRDFRYEGLASRAAFKDTLWGHLEAHEIFSPTKTYPSMSVKELAQ